DKANLMEAALNCTEFFRNESCGKCVPCRLGSQKLVELLSGMLQSRGPGKIASNPLHAANFQTEQSSNGHSSDGELAIVDDLSHMLLEAAICGLGWVVPSPIRSLVKHFPHIVERYVKQAAVN